jgi:CelD/BcsL family acetyltransferase involved in cellulose biosynthesis
MLHERGFDTFDFSIGDCAYKRRLGADSGELFDLAGRCLRLGCRVRHISALKVRCGAILKWSPGDC